MKLEKQDYEAIASMIVNNEGIEYSKDDEVLELDYEFEEYGYVEDDYHCGYMNGTGAWVCTGVDFSLNGYEVFTDDGEEGKCDLDERVLYKAVEAAAVG